MKVNSYNVEFGYELVSVIPYAYFLQKNGKLKETKSGIGSESLYYFSPKHVINKGKRNWSNMIDFRASNMPNVWIHRNKLDTSQFLIPPYKDKYKNNKYKFDKPTICVCNRYNEEWGEAPINYFSLENLKEIFTLLQKKYQIVYVATEIPKELQDGVIPLGLGDYDFVKNNFKDVIIFQDLAKNKDWNTELLKVFANCEKYITMNGGYSILASYFGGTNIIFSKKSHEIKVNSFNLWYHQFGGSRVVHVDNEFELMTRIKSIYKDEDPLINVLVRTSKRPNAFKLTIDSILNQTYRNIRIIVSYDDEESYNYICNYPVNPIKVIKKENIPVNDSKEYGRIAPYNLYFNDMMEIVNDGWICYQDDDDVYNDNRAFEKIVKKIKSTDDFIMWRTYSSQKIVPDDCNWGNAPVNCDIGGNSYIFHSKYKKLAEWEAYRKGNYRVAKKLYKVTNPIYINEIFCRTQENKTGNGLCEDNLNGIEKLEAIENFNQPLINVIIRTHKRPTFFKNCINSIKKQNYSNLNIIVGVEYEDEETYNYVKEYKAKVIRYKKANAKKNKPSGNEYGDSFPFNYYLDLMSKSVEDGHIMYLDDDDMHCGNLLNEVAKEIQKGAELITWKANLNGKIMPSEDGFQSMINNNLPFLDVSGIGFCFDSKFKNKTDWNFFKNGDYRTYRNLYYICKNKAFINQILSEVQLSVHRGMTEKEINYKYEYQPIQIIMKYIVIKDNVNGSFFYKIGTILDLEQSTANALKSKGLVIEYDEEKEKLYLEKAKENCINESLGIMQDNEELINLQNENDALKAINDKLKEQIKEMKDKYETKEFKGKIKTKFKTNGNI